MRLVDADDYLKSLQLAISVLEKKKRECDEVQQFGIDLSISCIAATINGLAEQQTVEAVPLSWWHNLKETITELRDNNADDMECDAYKIGRFLCNMIDIIEKRGTQNEL